MLIALAVSRSRGGRVHVQHALSDRTDRGRGLRAERGAGAGARQGGHGGCAGCAHAGRSRRPGEGDGRKDFCVRRDAACRRRQAVRRCRCGARRAGRGDLQRQLPGARAIRRSRPRRGGEVDRSFGLRRLPGGAAGGAAHDPEGAGRDPAHRGVGEPQGLCPLGAVRHGQVRIARHGPEHGARARSARHPCGAFRHRRRDQERAPAGIAGSPCQHAGSDRHRGELPARAASAAQRVDVRTGAAAMGRAFLTRRPRLTGGPRDAKSSSNRCPASHQSRSANELAGAVSSNCPDRVRSAAPAVAGRLLGQQPVVQSGALHPGHVHICQCPRQPGPDPGPDHAGGSGECRRAMRRGRGGFRHGVRRRRGRAAAGLARRGAGDDRMRSGASHRAAAGGSDRRQ